MLEALDRKKKGKQRILVNEQKICNNISLSSELQNVPIIFETTLSTSCTAV